MENLEKICQQKHALTTVPVFPYYVAKALSGIWLSANAHGQLHTTPTQETKSGFAATKKHHSHMTQNVYARWSVKNLSYTPQGRIIVDAAVKAGIMKRAELKKALGCTDQVVVFVCRGGSIPRAFMEKLTRALSLTARQVSDLDRHQATGNGGARYCGSPEAQEAARAAVSSLGSIYAVAHATGLHPHTIQSALDGIHFARSGTVAKLRRAAP